MAGGGALRHATCDRRYPTCIRDPASIKSSDLKSPACIGDPAST